MRRRELSRPGRSRSGMTALELAKTVARQAGELAADRFFETRQVTQKGRGNVVTEIDLLSEKTIKDFLRREYPLHGILAEESAGIQGDSEFLWIIDPIDGTCNYAWGIPHFAVNVALSFAGEVLVGVTYDPVRHELFWAEKGQGAFRNGTAIAASRRATLAESVLGLDLGYDAELTRQLMEIVMALWPGMQNFRVLGSAALGLAYAACGRVGLYLQPTLKPWDLASGWLLVQEAGGVICERDGSPLELTSTSVIAGGPAVHADLLRLTAGMKWRQLQ